MCGASRFPRKTSLPSSLTKPRHLLTPACPFPLLVIATLPLQPQHPGCPSITTTVRGLHAVTLPSIPTHRRPSSACKALPGFLTRAPKPYRDNKVKIARSPSDNDVSKRYPRRVPCRAMPSNPLLPASTRRNVTRGPCRGTTPSEASRGLPWAHVMKHP